MPLKIPEADPCPCCQALHGDGPACFVSRGELVSAFLNPLQYERGALLVVTNKHEGSVLEVEPTTLDAVYREAQRLSRVLLDCLEAEGINIFQNNGLKAGQTVGHYHVHVVPRFRNSHPGRIFKEADFESVSFQVLQALADQIRAFINDGNYD